MMDIEVDGKIALVLGAGGGLGGAIARRLAGEGARVAVADLRLEAAEKTVAIIRTNGGDAMPLSWDLADLEKGLASVDQIESSLGAVDILVNNTGGPPPSSVTGQHRDVWSKYFESMVLPVIALTDRVLGGMRQHGWGRIVTSVSSGVVAPIQNLGISNVLRSNLVGWNKTLAREVGPYGITANLVIPGRIATARTLQLDQARADRDHLALSEVEAASTAAIPLGRYGTPEEFADVVTFLCGNAASYVTGSMIRIDGGYIASI